MVTCGLFMKRALSLFPSSLEGWAAAECPPSAPSMEKRDGCEQVSY